MNHGVYKDYYRLTNQEQMTHSMSRVGKYIYNVPIEIFFGYKNLRQSTMIKEVLDL